MSKSLKNFITIRQALAMHSARQLRLMFLMQRWDRGMSYSDQAMDMAKAEEQKLKYFLGSFKFFTRHGGAQGETSDQDAALLAKVTAADAAVGDALRDNFNTVAVVDVLSKLVDEMRPVLDKMPDAGLEPVNAAAELIERTYDVLGVVGLSSDRGHWAAWAKGVDTLAEFRQTVRQLAKAKASKEEILTAVASAMPAIDAIKAHGEVLADLAIVMESFASDVRGMAQSSAAPAAYLSRCDEVRDRDCITLGVRLVDRGADGFLWMFDEPAVLERELREAAEKAQAIAREKLRNKLVQKQAEVKSAEKAMVKPEDLFRATGLYSVFDEKGLPTKLQSGDDLPKSKAKDLVKEMAKQEKAHASLVKQAGATAVDVYVAKLRSEAADLEAAINKC